MTRAGSPADDAASNNGSAARVMVNGAFTFKSWTRDHAVGTETPRESYAVT